MEHTLRVLITALLWLLAASGLCTTLAAAGAGSAAVPVVISMVSALASLAPAVGKAVAAVACSAVATAVTRVAVPGARTAYGAAICAARATSRAVPDAAPTATAATHVAMRRLARAACWCAALAVRAASVAVPLATATAVTSGSTALAIVLPMLSFAFALAAAGLPVAALTAGRVLVAALVAGLQAAWAAAWLSPSPSQSTAVPFPVPGTPCFWRPRSGAVAVPSRRRSSPLSEGLAGEAVLPPRPLPCIPPAARTVAFPSSKSVASTVDACKGEPVTTFKMAAAHGCRRAASLAAHVAKAVARRRGQRVKAAPILPVVCLVPRRGMCARAPWKRAFRSAL